VLKVLFSAIFILSCLLATASGESNFFKKYPGQASNCGYAIAVSPTGKIGVAGLQFNNSDERTLLHGQMDADGKGTSLYTFDTGRADDTVSAIAATGDGGFIVASNTSGDSTNRDILIMKVKSDGAVAWKKRITTSNHEIVYSMAKVPGGYVLVGANVANDVDALLIKITESGSIAWKKSYATTDEDFGYAVTSTEQGELLMAGIQVNSPFVLKLSATGRRIWGRLIPTEIYSADGRLSILDTGGFHFLIGTSTEGEHAHGGIEHTGISVTKLTSNGSIVWTREYFSKDAIVAWNATVATNGNIIIAGHAGSITAKALLFEINTDGKFQWKRAYFTENSAAFNVVSSGESIFITGCTGKDRLELYLAKADVKGNIPQACGRWKNITMGVDLIPDSTIPFAPQEKTFSGVSASSSITTRKMNSDSKDLCNPDK
jgi:outer membrane protein assembly factor BamB